MTRSHGEDASTWRLWRRRGHANEIGNRFDARGKATPDLYDALGWIAERVSRIKLKHDDPTGIGAFEAFETISLGILGKRALWEALQPPSRTPSWARHSVTATARASFTA